MSVSRVGQRGQVVIPQGICEEVSLHEGDFVEVSRAKGAVMIRPKKLVDPVIVDLKHLVSHNDSNHDSQKTDGAAYGPWV